MKKPSAKQINTRLPQTQCGECDYGACMPYAEAMAAGRADIERCAPGGTETLFQLADLLQRNPEPFIEHVESRYKPAAKVTIQEDLCIGCTKCIQACPVDAIVGGPKLMHSVITAECTGCELCIEPCPIDCIDIIPSAKLADDLEEKRRAKSQQRFEAREQRLLEKKQAKRKHYSQNANAAEKQRLIAAAVARAKAKQQEL